MVYRVLWAGEVSWKRVPAHLVLRAEKGLWAVRSSQENRMPGSLHQSLFVSLNPKPYSGGKPKGDEKPDSQPQQKPLISLDQPHNKPKPQGTHLLLPGTWPSLEPSNDFRVY